MVNDGIRNMFFMIDKVIYKWIVDVYDFVLELSRVNIFDQETLGKLALNIYSVIGIFMLFKLSFNILQYIVSPESFTDKNKGIGKVVQNVVIVLVLIAGVPFIFRLAIDLQTTIVNNGIIEGLILGRNKMTGAATSNSPGNMMSRVTFSAFLNCGKPGDKADCQDDTQGKILIDGLINGMELDLVEINYEKNSTYYFNYSFPLSTLAGVVVLFMLIIFSYDMALRTVKLGFLQIISPIPIISFIDPSSSVSKGMFGNWVKLCKDAYLGLFIRLLSLAFVVFIVHYLNSDPFSKMLENAKIATDHQIFIQIFIIIGALFFAKEAPKMLESLFGGNLSAGFGGMKALNPFNRMAGGAAILGAAGLAKSAAVGLPAYLAGGIASKAKGGSFFAGGAKTAKAWNDRTNFAKKGAVAASWKSWWGEKSKDSQALSDAGIEEKKVRDMETAMAGGASVESMINDNDTRTAFSAHKTAKADTKTAKTDLTTAQNNLTTNQNQLEASRSKLVAAQNKKIIEQNNERTAIEKLNDTRTKLAAERAKKASIDAELSAELAKGSSKDIFKVAALTSQSSSSASAILTLGGQVTTDNAAVTAIQTNISTINTEISDAQTVITTAESNTASLTAAVSTAQTNLTSKQRAEESAKAKLDDEISKPRNKKDKETVDRYNKGKSQGRWS